MSELLALRNDLAAEPGYLRDPADNREPSGRPQLLFLCQTLPFPPDGGVMIRSFNILRLLSTVFDVTALCFYRRQTRRSEREVEQSVAGLSEFAHVEAFPIAQEHSRGRLVYDHLRSILLRRAYTRYAYASTAFEGRLRELLASRTFDLVHVDSLDLSGYLPLLKGLPIVCTHHNVESALLLRRARVARSLVLRAYLRQQAQLTRKEEQHWCNRIDLNLAVSESDRAELAALAPGARISIVPNGVDTKQFTPASGRGDGLVFVGAHDWFPNRDAMQFFVDDILPLLSEAGDAARLTWVGNASPEIRDEFARQFGVQMTGYVQDVRPYVQGAACYIVPLRVGGGTRLKILDAWAMGKAVVSTSVGCEGLDAKDNVNILIRDTAEDFAEAVLNILRSEKLRARLGGAARATAVDVYDWDVIGRTFLREYQNIALKRAGTSRA